MHYLPPAVVLSYLLSPYLLSPFLLSPIDGFMDFRRRRGTLSLPLREILEILEICFPSYYLLVTGMSNLGNLNKSMNYLPPAVVLSYLLSPYLLSPKDGFMDYRRRRGERR